MGEDKEKENKQGYPATEGTYQEISGKPDRQTFLKVVSFDVGVESHSFAPAMKRKVTDPTRSILSKCLCC